MKVPLDDIYLKYFKKSLSVFEKILADDDFLIKIKKTAEIISLSFAEDHKVLIAGNGGSAADAQHLATEFMVRLEKKDNRRSLPVIALNTNSSLITAAGNDFGFKTIFSRQIEGFGNKGDVFIGISTSGTSENIVNAFNTAKNRGLHCILFTGEKEIKENWEIVLSIPTKETNIIQIAHSLIEHILVKMVLNLTF